MYGNRPYPKLCKATQVLYTIRFMNTILSFHFRVAWIRDILTEGVVCTGAYGRMVSSAYKSSSSFMRHKYVVLLFKIWCSKVAKSRNDASKQVYFAVCSN